MDFIGNFTNMLGSSVINGLGNGLQNIISGGNWRVDGASMETMKYNTQQAELQRAFEREMNDLKYERDLQLSSTAYQRAVADMKKAGLNPGLLFSNGSPAVSPSQIVPSGQSAQTKNYSHDNDFFNNYENRLNNKINNKRNAFLNFAGSALRIAALTLL